MVEIVALRERFEHMSRISGYDALYHHFTPEIKVDSIFCNYKKIYPRGIGRLLSVTAKRISASGFYNAQSVEAELRLAARSLKKRYDIVHYSYGESYYGFGPLKKNDAAVVLTHHQPVSWWRAHETVLNKYDHVDRVIALSGYDRDYFNQYLNGKAVCIPHGVDVDFYTPADGPEKETSVFRVVFAGRYLRDMETLSQVIKKMLAGGLNIRFDVVYIQQKHVWQQYLKDIMGLPGVTWHAGVTEQQLRTLYQQADCCLIPLEDCTANNAILEAMACGLPVISTGLPAISTYLDDTVALLGRKKHVDDLCDAILLLYQNETLKKTMSANARKKAVTCFDWNLIAQKTADLFKSAQ